MVIFEIIGFLGWILIAAFPFMWYRGWQEKRRRIEAERVMLKEFASRICPHCQRRYGDQALATHYGQPYETIEMGGKPITRAVILHCSHCETYATYDPLGHVIPQLVFHQRDVDLLFA